MWDPEQERPKVVVELDRCTCEHCDLAEAELRRLCERFAAVLRVRRVDLEEWLKNLAGWKTPIVYVDGRQVSQVSVTPKKWEAAIRGKAQEYKFDVSGEVIDLECHLKNESRGEKHVRCAVECLGRGEPVGLLTPQEQVYLLLADERWRKMLIQNAGKDVTVTGQIFRKGGVQALVVEVIR